MQDNQSLAFQYTLDDYRRQLIIDGYSSDTIQRHHKVLKHLEIFLLQRGIDLNTQFSMKIIEEFKSECPVRRTSSVINGLIRHLSGKKVTSSRLKQNQLPNLYEEYIGQYTISHRVHERTIQNMRFVLGEFYRFLNQSEILETDLTIIHIDSFLSTSTAGLASETVRKRRSVLRGFLRYLYSIRGILKKDLASLMIAAPVFCRNNPPRFLRRDELQQVFQYPLTDGSDMLSQALLYLAYCTGLRPSEISRIRLDDILFTENRIIIPVRKGRNPVEFPLPDKAIQTIADYVIQARPKSNLRELFLNTCTPYEPLTAQQVSRRISERLRKVHPTATAYWLRHSYAQSLLESGASIFEIKEMLGHDDIKTTSRYLHIHTSWMRKVLFDETF